jgi:hypothetical protein
MTRDEQFIIENAAADADLDLLLAVHRCVDCAADAFLDVDGEWLCVECAGTAERRSSTHAIERRAA